jgi:MFS family permease
VDEWPWLDEQPVFTTRGERGGNVPRVPADAVLEPVRASYVMIVAAFAMCLGFALAGVAVLVASLSEGLGAASWWWLALAVPGAALALFFFAGAYTRGMELFMRERARNLVVLAGLFGALAVGLGALAAWWVARGAAHPVGRESGLSSEPSNALWLGIAALAALALCLVATWFAARSARRARRDVARILRLRTEVRPVTGIVAKLPDPESWNHGGDVPIRYEDAAGWHTLTVRVNTWAHEIPVVGTRVLVYLDAAGEPLVELDPAHPVAFHPDSRAYESDTSGGGS